MPYILCIETATPVCSVALVNKKGVLGVKDSQKKNSHAEVITVLIEQLLADAGMKISGIDAVAVSMGPGSYTGLRIGVSTAKGLCYAGDIPLLAVGTLQCMALGMINKNLPLKPELYCPMIDARRMEVYNALFDSQGHEIRNTAAEIISPDSFRVELTQSKILFFGDGAEKCIHTLRHPNAFFEPGFQVSAAFMQALAVKLFTEKRFENTAYFEPYYLKDFVAGIPKVKGLK